MGSDKVAKKIVELSKKNRELAAEVGRHKSRAKELQETVNKLEVSVQVLQSTGESAWWLALFDEGLHVSCTCTQ